MADRYIPNPRFNIWEHSSLLRELLKKRALGREEEMDCAAQAAEIIGPLVWGPGLTLLDVGCGAGHFIHSLKARNIDIEYRGLDSSPTAIAIGQEAFAALGFDPGSLALASAEGADIPGVDIALIMNVLSFNPDFRAILERISLCGPRHILIRDSFGPSTRIRFARDGYLDEGFNHLSGYWNRYGRTVFAAYLQSLGFKSQWLVDRRTGGRMERVVDKPYYWAWCLASRLEDNPPENVKAL
jgi:SAM-dependent methyltransferase